ncbi:MAG: hypothetical protein HWE20_06040 [Gammaproteobacteria bacterium]|nr:hypothetical protein [Gammaproteobacteria bacterium]
MVTRVASFMAIGFVGALAWLPHSFKNTIARAFAALSYRHYPKARHIAERNLRLCFPQMHGEALQAALRDYFFNWARIWLDVGYIWWGSRAQIDRLVEIEGEAHLQSALSAGPVIILVNHSLNLEMASQALNVRFDMIGFVKAPKNQALANVVHQSRARFGATLLPRESGLRAVIKALRPGRALYYFADEDFEGKHAVESSLFGYQRPTLRVLAGLARTSGAQVVPLTAQFDSETGLYRLSIQPPIANVETVQQAADLVSAHLERELRENPSQYLLRIPLFRSVPLAVKPYGW